MKKKIGLIMVTLMITAMACTSVIGQGKFDDQRMERDIQVAENVLSTLMRQQFGKRNFFPMEVQGSYMPGFGATFRLPTELTSQIMILNDGDNVGFGYSNDFGGTKVAIAGSSDDECADCPSRATAPRAKTRTLTARAQTMKRSSDSLRTTFNHAIIQAARDFIADYGDMISQLGPDERIVVTNKSEGGRNNWLYRMDANRSGMYMSMEATKADLTLFKQGKLTRDQFFAKIRTVDSETTDDLSPDLELLGSIFNRLYRADLSKTYFLQEEVYYERLKDYGVIYNMHAYSSTVLTEEYMNNGKIRTLYEMPTLQLSGIDRDERLKKVKELYPSFEKNIIDDILEYSKTLRSLKDNEVVIFNVKLTECKGCNIPTSLEITFKESVLKDYSSGKLTREAALAKGIVKKGPNQ